MSDTDDNIPTEDEGLTTAVRTRKKKSDHKKGGEKRGPGRPCKQPKKEMPQRKGIMTSPTNAQHTMEFWYDQPMFFKKIAQFFKAMAAKNLQMLFRKEEIIIYAPDHHKKSKIRVRIDARKLNMYYLREPIDIGINTKELDSITNPINKEYGNLLLWSNQGESQKCINISMEDEVKSIVKYSIDLFGSYEKMEDETKFLDENYTIKLNIPGKYFKSRINDIRAMSQKMAIVQTNMTSPLRFEYRTGNNKIRSEQIIRNNSRINYASTLSGEKTLWVEINVDYIRPISSALLSESMQWFIDENKSTMIKTMLDSGTIEIKVLTEIVDERRSGEVVQD